MRRGREKEKEEERERERLDNGHRMRRDGEGREGVPERIRL